MRRLLFALALFGTAWSQPNVTVGGAPFLGKVEWSGDRPWIEIEALAHRAGWARHPAYSGWCYRRQDEGEACPTKDLIGKGQTFLQGERVETREVDGVKLVSLETVRRLFELQISPTWDIDLPEAAPANPLLPVQPPHTAAVSLAGHLKPGKVHVGVFYTQWCPACWKYFPTLEKMARQHPEIELVELDIGEFGSPMCQQNGIRATPWVKIFNDQGQVTADGNAAEAWLKEKYTVTMPTTLKCVGAPGN